MTYVKENGTTEIGFYDYDILSRRSKLRFAGNESNRSTYFYEADNDLDVLTQLMNSTTVTLDYGRNNAGQITRIDASDEFYLPKPTTSFSHAYVPDKLNRYSSVKGLAATYDSNGNMLTRYPLNGTTKDTFTYDSENRLVTAGGERQQHRHDQLRLRCAGKASEEDRRQHRHAVPAGWR